ncbi:MAG: bifunctional heptose 7-phosphate kinase/heptose 1-phosphate adenyltransferase [Ignavibacteria bacterium]|jgi:rfaE bifunctional protein kinase chain/domain
MHEVQRDRTEAHLAALSGAEIAVVGDVMLDRYFWGSVHRVSPEAPVPVIDVERESAHLGGAANVATNLLGLGAKPVLCGVVGDDAAGAHVRMLCAEAGLGIDTIATSGRRPTTTKTRIIGNSQHIARLDNETREHVSEEVAQDIITRLTQHTAIKGIILEDYDKGLLSPWLINAVIELGRSRHIPVFVDPKHRHFFDFVGCTVFKPNKKEASDALGMPLTTLEEIEKAGRTLRNTLKCENVLITLGAAGMMLIERDGTLSTVPTRAMNVSDVSGAGDTVIATLAAMMSVGVHVREAAALANIAAGHVVSEPGIVAITAADLLSALPA